LYFGAGKSSEQKGEQETKPFRERGIKACTAMGASLITAGYARSLTIPGRSRVANCRRKFLRFFPQGFHDETLSQGKFLEIGAEAVKIESRTNLLFSFEKMAIRDALKLERGARAFAEGLYALLYGRGSVHTRFARWCEVVAALPRKQSRVLTWPLATIFGFIAQPETHIFLKPTVTRLAAREYGFDFRYRSGPSWETYSSFLEFAREIEHDVRDLRPRDLIDIQSFIWVLGSDEYEAK
jgi:hypothetical protein